MSERIAIIGLGYVGLPVAVALARVFPGTIGFDISERRVAALRAGIDHTGEITAAELGEAALTLTTNPADLAGVGFFIVTVPTPIDEQRRPDLEPLRQACRTIARVLRPGCAVVFESTVYPGVTEEVCGPLLGQLSGLQPGVDFGLGYSPERINPGDTTHRLGNVIKVVSASDKKTLARLIKVYGAIVPAGLHCAPSIKVAEAAKVIENTQRDLNIALMNELAIIFDRMGIDTNDVLEAAGTKWNFLKFKPGLVGGHCIGVDPYYLTHRAEKAGYHPEVILAGRRINDSVGKRVALECVRSLLKSGTEAPRVTVLGLTFKENIVDIRNSQVFDIVRELESFGVSVQVNDPLADSAAALKEYGLTLESEPQPADAVVLAVPHDTYRNSGWPLIVRLLKSGRGLV